MSVCSAAGVDTWVQKAGYVQLLNKSQSSFTAILTEQIVTYSLFFSHTHTQASKDTAEHHTLLASYLLQRGERGSGGDGHSPNISLFLTLFFDCKLICSVKGCAVVL